EGAGLPVFLHLVRLAPIRPQNRVTTALEPDHVRGGPVAVVAGEATTGGSGDVRPEHAVGQLELVAGPLAIGEASVRLGVERPLALPAWSVEDPLHVLPVVGEARAAHADDTRDPL